MACECEWLLENVKAMLHETILNDYFSRYAFNMPDKTIFKVTSTLASTLRVLIWSQNLAAQNHEFFAALCKKSSLQIVSCISLTEDVWHTQVYDIYNFFCSLRSFVRSLVYSLLRSLSLSLSLSQNSTLRKWTRDRETKICKKLSIELYIPNDYFLIGFDS